MNKISLNSIILMGFILAASVYYFLGLPAVPFQPDESTQIYMSSDLDLLLHDPASLYWKPNQKSDLHQYYREMDAPLTRYLVGISRLVEGLPALPVDWNWTLTWQGNEAHQALPNDQLLLAARMGVSFLFPFTLLLMYTSGTILGGRVMGWAALLLTATNALILLHTRRAMAESALVFTVALSLWVLLKSNRHHWIAAIPVGLAFNAKQSAVILIIPTLVAILWNKKSEPTTLIHRLGRAGLFGAIFIAITLLLNPFLWSAPIPAASESVLQRARFTQEQVGVMQALGNSNIVLNSLSERVGGLLYQVFFNLPAIEDVGNYHKQTLAVSRIYLANGLHTILRSMAGGLALLIITLLGTLFSFREIIRGPEEKRRPWVLLLLVSGLQVIILIWLISVPFQRYYIVLIPSLTLLAAFGCRQTILVLASIGTLIGKELYPFFHQDKAHSE